MAATGPPRRAPFMNRVPDSQPVRPGFHPALGHGTNALMITVLAAAALATAAPDAPTPYPPSAYETEQTNDLLAYRLEYPAEVAAIPALADAIRAQAEQRKAENLKLAAEDKAGRAKDGYPFFAYEQSDAIALVGKTSRLLSLADDWFLSSGGAHPNHGTKALLWDIAAGAEIAVGALLDGGADALEQLYRERYCAALDVERKARRQGEDEAPDPSDPFWQCPKFADLAILPKGPAEGGPLTSLVFHANPYVAGPYVEGDYDVELPVTAAFIAALRPDYRSSFAVP
jgi:hypothetical protein